MKISIKWTLPQHHQCKEGHSDMTLLPQSFQNHNCCISGQYIVVQIARIECNQPL